MDRSLEVRTPESVAFQHQLAGVGSRFLAVTADMFVQAILVVAALFALAFLGTRTHVSTSGKVAENVVLGVYIGVLFLIVFGYYLLFEAFWHGQTPGKRLLGIRVVRDGGYPIDFSASLIRNLIRVGEWSFGFYAIAAISTLLSSENKRIGDFAAGTIVVRDAGLSTPPALQGPDRPTYAPSSLLSGEERALVHRFIERRESLSAQYRAELASQLAQRIRPRAGPDLAKLDDESLLERL